MFLLKWNRDKLRKFLCQVSDKSDEMVTTVPSDLCFLIYYRSCILWLYLLLALIVLGIHTYLLVNQCCFSASSRTSLPASLFSLFIAVARSNSLLHHLFSCFPQASNSHRPLLPPHHSIPVLVSPGLHIPTPTDQSQEMSLEEDPPDAWEDARVCLSSDSERLWNCPRLESRALWGRLKATFEQVKQLPLLSACPRHTPGLWESGEGTQGRLPCRAPAFTPLQHFWRAGQFFPSERSFSCCPHSPLLVAAGRALAQPAPSPLSACSKSRG